VDASTPNTRIKRKICTTFNNPLFQLNTVRVVTSSLDFFSLRDSVVGEYRKFATSFMTIHASDIRRHVEAIYAEGRFWPAPRP
jgi:hypothetical protein